MPEERGLYPTMRLLERIVYFAHAGGRPQTVRRLSAA